MVESSPARKSVCVELSESSELIHDALGCLIDDEYLDPVMLRRHKKTGRAATTILLLAVITLGRNANLGGLGGLRPAG